MKKLLICSLLVLTGCATRIAGTGPVWPSTPPELTAPVADLTPLAEGKTSFSDMLLNINENYTAYYVLKNKFELWQQWYKEQKEIYNKSEK